VASKNARIEQVFNSALTTWAKSQSLPVAWDGKPYTPAANSKYISQVLLPSRPENVAIGKDATQRYSGIYQVDIYTSTANAKKDADDIVELLEAVFKVGYPITYKGLGVQVTNFYPDPHGFDEGWYRVSVSIFYRTEL